MSSLQLPGKENVVLSAYSEFMKGDSSSPEELVAEYQRLFVSVAQPVGGRHTVFERFSLVDPNIRTVLGSSTVMP